MDEVFDAIVVGGGLAGLSAAYTLAQEGKEVIVLERGDYCGAKNVTGGRMYVSPIRDMFPDLWKKAPFEREVTHEEICLMAKERSINIRYDGSELGGEQPQSYTVCRAKFDKWFAKQAERKGAMVITKTKVEDVIKKDGKVVGVVANGDELYANVVIACDGVLSFTAQAAGLKKPFLPQDYAVGVKEVIELDRSVIEDRFNLTGDEGVARLYLGDATMGNFGGGFLYTNKESINIGIVAGIHDLMGVDEECAAPEMFQHFKERPEVACLIEGGETVEYSAHVISEAGKGAFSKLYGDGILVTGDAAGFGMNIGLLVRGMEYAMASGYFAAKAVIIACEKGDFSAATLKIYEDMLKESFVLKDFDSFEKAPEVLDKPYLFSELPELAGNVMRDVFHVPNGPKEKIFASVKKHLTFKELRAVVKNVGGFRKL